MDTSYYKKYEPFFGSWYIKEKIGEGSFGSVYTIERKEMGKVYHSALKVITVPQSNSEIKSLLSEGMTHAETVNYYRDVVENIVNECELMSELKGLSNIVSYEDHMCIPHDDGIGFDILIRMELLTPLLDFLVKNPMTERQIIKLGIDICKALEICSKRNIIHRDIKPENIFISSFGDYKLGDFGIARTIEKTSGGLSKKGTYTYMAPEVYKGETYGASADIYSLGIVLYRLLNGNRAPFLPPFPQPITHNAKEEAIIRRVSGEKVPAINGIGPTLSEIVLKACEYRPEDRYRSAEEMREALESYYTTNDNDIQEHTLFLEAELTDEPTEKPIIEETLTDEQIEDGLSTSEPSIAEPKKKSGKKIIAIVGACVVILVAVYMILPGVVTEVNGINEKETIVVGESLSPNYEVVHKKLRAKELIFTVDDEAIAIVDDKGIITAGNTGSTTLRITAGDYEKRVRIDVITKVTAINNVSDISLYDGDKEQLKPVLSPEEYADEPITYTSDNQKVVKVNSKGVITSVGCGSAKIKIESGGCIKTIRVTVKEKSVYKPVKKSKPKKKKRTYEGTWE